MALTRDPGSTGEGELAALRDAGLDARAILDLTHVIGFFAYANRLGDGLGGELEAGMDEAEADGD